MNPAAEGLDKDRLPPLADVRRNLHIRWYRCPLEREKLRELTEPSDLQGMILAVGHLGLWVVTGLAAYYLFDQQVWWGFLVALFAHGTVASFFTAPHHELCHTTVFRTKWLNELFLRVFSLIGWLNFHVYRFSHSYHHRYTSSSTAIARRCCQRAPRCASRTWRNCSRSTSPAATSPAAWCRR